ncbi:hypothetical protein Hdeb2414_s0008g00275051 [Helianthus debilis subsp. tardiflorus]
MYLLRLYDSVCMNRVDLCNYASVRGLVGLWIGVLDLGFTGSGVQELCFGLTGRDGGMEPAAGKRKGRKRKRKDGEDVDKPEETARKTVLAIRSVVLIERYVKMMFECGLFTKMGILRIWKRTKRKRFLSGTMKWIVRFVNGRSLLISGGAEDDKDETVSNDNDANADKVESSAAGADQVEVDSESSSDLSYYEPSVNVVELERPWVPPPQLPSLLEITGFPRRMCHTFYPYIAFFGRLAFNVETLSSEGSELASKCLRYLFPVFVNSLSYILKNVFFCS